jgi:tetratricopeptide (TPR) repeat protein
METGDRAAALRELKDAERLDPNNLLVLGRLAGGAFDRGRPDEAVDLQRRVVVRDPLGLAARQTLGLFLFSAGRFDEAGIELQTVLQIAGSPVAPDEFPQGIRASAAFDFARSLMAERRFAEARLEIESWPAGPFRDHGIALVQHGLGNGAEANAALKRLSETAGEHAWLIAEIYAYRDDAERAFKWLSIASQQARRSGEWLQPWKLDVRYSPFFAPLHRDPRWKAWLAENNSAIDFGERGHPSQRRQGQARN